ncbi:MAG: hypothetical protein ACYC7A_20640 [Thermoanaerobaculia bacterium]
MILPEGFTADEIRVLQEFRRTAQDSLTAEQIVAIHHPADGGEAPAKRLIDKGYLTSGDGAYVLTERAREFLARDVKP